MSTIQHHPVTITAPDGLPWVDIEREFDATPEQVFRAHTEPDLVSRWMGPHDLVNEIDHWDARDGGSWRYVARRGTDEFWFRGCFHQLVPGQRIVQTFTYEGFPDGVSLEILELDPLDGGRCRLRARSVTSSVEGRDAFVASGMESGVVAGYEKLDDLLAG
ncbi:SRPBCC family protein [Nocardioides sp.]|uniref:SRPBCC family protein n=1 Tax=Nocardioides sp. TaxID=35761 RepID=UPI0035295634